LIKPELYDIIIIESSSVDHPEHNMERKDKMRPKHLVTALLTAALLSSCSGSHVNSSSSSEDDTKTVTKTVSEEMADTASDTLTDTPADTQQDNIQSTDSSKEASTEEGAKAFDISILTDALPGISSSYEDNCIYESGTSGGYDFDLVIDLNKWAGKTSPDQIKTISQVFWECYPRMYDRFGVTARASRTAFIAIEDEDYSPAYTLGNWIHLHDEWLQENPTDFDVITHELTHIIQNDWNPETCEFSEYIERFADFCRYEYAFQDGIYNDACWTLWEADKEDSLASSNRFFVWLDYTYSTPENDIMLNFFRVCCEGKYKANDWDKAWEEIFAGSALEGRHIYDVWTEFTKTDFAYLSATSSDGPSELLKRYDIRGRLK